MHIVIVELIGAALLLAVLAMLVLVLRAVTRDAHQPSSPAGAANEQAAGVRGTGPVAHPVGLAAVVGSSGDSDPDEARRRDPNAVTNSGPELGTQAGPDVSPELGTNAGPDVDHQPTPAGGAVVARQPTPAGGADVARQPTPDAGGEVGRPPGQDGQRVRDVEAGAALTPTPRPGAGPGSDVRPGPIARSDSVVGAGPTADPAAGQDERRQADLERREARLAERERRLDDERLRLDARAAAASEAEQRSVVAARALGDRETEAKAARAEVGLERDRMRTALEAEAWQVRAELAADARLARAELEARRLAAAAELQRERTQALEHVAQLTTQAAREEVLLAIEHATKREAALTVRQIEAEARELGEQRARSIVADAVQRVASEQTAESVVSVLQLPSDDMKGRIIGREGRNIRAFESLTGVNVVIDDTPEAVLLSCFDPIRREVGRRTLEALVLDGRIQPQRIEELYERSKVEVETGMLRAGEDALLQVGITDVHPDLVALLGRLRYRTSYGQNVLKHLIETAHIAGMMAAELRLDPATTKRGAFFHDIGKALGHEVEGSHASIGADLARRYGEAEDVVHAIAAHHGEVAAETIEAVLTQASDSCSGGRPGARRESLESYVQRLHRIEEIASTRPGVDKVFAMQAGREVRVMVLPDEVDDLGALVLAREVAKQIEDELTYPGQIRVTVVRESRATEIAH